MDWNQTHWGGRTNPLIFFNGGTLAEQDWLHLEVADPDCISVVGGIPKTLIKEIDDRVQPWGFEICEKPEGTEFKLPHEAQGISVPPTPHNLRRLKVPLYTNPKLLLFQFAAGCDRDVKRFLHRNFGTFYQWFDQNKKQIRHVGWLEDLLPKIETHQFHISDAASLGSVLTQLSGRMRRGDIRPALPFIAPFELASIDREAWAGDFSESYQVVIGDKPLDFRLFWNEMLPRQNWWRTYERQLWIPTSLIRNPAFYESFLDWLRHFTGHGSQGRRVELASYTLSAEELEELRKALYTADPALPTNPVNPGSQDRIRRRLEEEMERTRKFLPWDWRTNTERLTGLNREERFPIPDPAILTDEFNRDGNWMVDLQIEHSSIFTNGPREQSWWRLPRQNSGGLMRSLFHAPARINGEGRFSVLVGRRNQFMSPVVKPEVTLSLPEDADVIRHLLLRPHTSPCFTSDPRYEKQPAQPEIVGCRISEKGASLAALIDVFGDFWTARSFCERRFWRNLFRKLAGYGPGDDEKLRGTVNELLVKQAFADSPEATEKAPHLTDKILQLVRGRLRSHYLNQNQCARLRSTIEKEASPDPLVYGQGNTVVHQQGHTPVSQDEMQQGLNHLLGIGLLRLGIETTCPTCKLSTWHHVDELRQNLSCAGCGSQHSLTANERWSYSLNTLAQSAVSQGVLGVLHALAALAFHSHGFFAFSPNLELFRVGAKDPWRELDILAVTEGEFVIGEVKEGYVQKAAFEGLAEAAEILLPQRAIIFLPLEHAKKQREELNQWLTEAQSRLAPKGISAEIFTLPEY